MAFNEYEQSRDRGQPVMLFKFTYGVSPTGDPIFLAYTDGETPVTHEGAVFEPLPLRVSRIEASGRLEGGEVTIRLPRTSQIAQLFAGFPPSRVVSLKIWQGHIPNGDDPAEFLAGDQFSLAWVGRILESSRSGAETTLTGEASSASLRRTGLRRHYQWPCPLALYGTRCGASKAAATVTATVVSVSSNRVVLAEPWQQQIGGAEAGAENYVGGLVEWTGDTGAEQRTIMRVEGLAELVLGGPAFGLAAGDTVSVSLGCPRSLTACADLHDNIVNYGGHPFIPSYNPFGKNNHL